MKISKHSMESIDQKTNEFEQNALIKKKFQKIIWKKFKAKSYRIINKCICGGRASFSSDNGRGWGVHIETTSEMNE